MIPVRSPDGDSQVATTCQRALGGSSELPSGKSGKGTYVYTRGIVHFRNGFDAFKPTRLVPHDIRIGRSAFQPDMHKRIQLNL